MGGHSHRLRGLLLGIASLLPRALAEPLRRNAPIAQSFNDGVDDLLSPRDSFYPDIGPVLMRRDGGGCAANYHSCLDINSTECCPNSMYCMVDPTDFSPACCSIGSTCNSPCAESQYECNATSTVTLFSAMTSTATPSGQSSATIPAEATATTTSVYLACCPRRCTGTSMFACASSFGGGCCSFGQTCASGSQCIWTATSSSLSSSSGPSATTKAILTDATSASTCGTSQISCAASLGTGCCNNGYTCTVVTNDLFCALETGTVVSGSRKGGLSAGAKAGIAIGVVVGAAAVLGGATWACVHQRRRRQSFYGSGSQNPGGYDPYQQSQSVGQPNVGGGMVFHSAQPDGAFPTAISPTTTSPVRSWRNPLQRRRNTASGSNGSVPVIDPVVTGDADKNAVSPHSPGGFSIFSPGGFERGVPIAPHGPHDIVAPVEIDSTPAHPQSQDIDSIAATPMDTSSISATPVSVIRPSLPIMAAAAGESYSPNFPDSDDEKGMMERMAYGIQLPPPPPAYALPSELGDTGVPAPQPSASSSADADFVESPILPRAQFPGTHDQASSESQRERSTPP